MSSTSVIQTGLPSLYAIGNPDQWHRHRRPGLPVYAISDGIEKSSRDRQRDHAGTTEKTTGRVHGSPFDAAMRLLSAAMSSHFQAVHRTPRRTGAG